MNDQNITDEQAQALHRDLQALYYRRTTELRGSSLIARRLAVLNTAIAEGERKLAAMLGAENADALRELAERDKQERGGR